MALSKLERRQRIKHRIRKIVAGNETRPRLSVFRSNKEINAQLIDDLNGKTIVAVSSRDKGISKGTKIEVATQVGKALAELLFHKKNDIHEKNDVIFSVVGIATRSRGIAIDPEGLDLTQALDLVKSGQSLSQISKFPVSKK